MPTMSMRTMFVLRVWAFGLACATTSVGWAQGPSANPTSGAAETGMMIREIEYVAPPAAATPCPTPTDSSACVPPADESVKNFKMNVPDDWDVKQNVGSHALLMEPRVKLMPTPENPLVADPSLSVVVLRNPIPIDDQGLDEYAEEIEKGLNRQGDGPTGAVDPVARVFKVFSKTLMDLPNGHKGYLFYVSGVLSGVNVRQAILVASTQKVQFRVTLTDHEVTFDKTLERLFPVMTSIQLTSLPLERTGALTPWLPWLGLALVVAAILVAIKIVLLRRTRALISEFSMGGGESSAPSGAIATSEKPTSSYPDEDDI